MFSDSKVLREIVLSKFKYPMNTDYHSFNKHLATDFKLSEAIIIHQIHILCESNRRQEFKQYCIEDVWYCKVSYEQLSINSGYLSFDQIRRIVSHLKKDELVVTEKFKKTDWDHTFYYALSEKAKKYYVSYTDVAKRPHRSVETHTSERAKRTHLPKDNLSFNSSLVKDTNNVSSDDNNSFDKLLRYLWENWQNKGKRGADDKMLKKYLKEHNFYDDLIPHSARILEAFETNNIGDKQQLKFWLKNGDWENEYKKKPDTKANAKIIRQRQEEQKRKDAEIDARKYYLWENDREQYYKENPL